MDEPRSYPSPDGRYIFRVSGTEMRMSHWVYSGTLVESASQEHVFGFRDADWSLDVAQWRSPTVVAMTVRKYPGNHTPVDFTVVLDCESRTATVENIEIPPGSFSQVEAELDDYVRKHPRRPLPG